MHDKKNQRGILNTTVEEAKKQYDETHKKNKNKYIKLEKNTLLIT
ncbi:hypothetical protein LKV13_04310 [Borrelia sp. BU AG58]|nr:hypothetical protein LKV13_04310 [Borrelia sp. BU AG58]